MRITAITKKKGTRWQVDVDEEYWTILDAEIIVDHHLKTGIELTEARMEEILRAADLRRARERALYLLDYRDHSRAELVEKLSRNVDREIALEVVDRLSELGLINDDAYAKKLARQLILTKKYGPRRAVYELRMKGIDPGTAAEAVDEVEPEEGLLENLVLRKYGRYLQDDEDGKGRDKAIRALMRLGHGYYDAAAAVDAAAARLTKENGGELDPDE
ncbi:MAG: regulatory protein RecX [Candidatus Merdivicinus sp.]|jgi:regulatory protein